jgi:hypothetical protein
MSCALTSGFNLDCKTAIGGIKSVRLATLADYEAIVPVYDATGADVESFTSAADKFYKYEQLKETSSMTETINSNVQNGSIYYTPEVTIVLSKLASDKRNQIKLLGQNRLVAIIETNDEAANFFVAGVTTGLEVSAGTSATGTAYADLQGYTITLSGMEAAPMRKLTPSSGTTQAMLDSITH